MAHRDRRGVGKLKAVLAGEGAHEFIGHRRIIGRTRGSQKVTREVIGEGADGGDVLLETLSMMQSTCGRANITGRFARMWESCEGGRGAKGRCLLAGIDGESRRRQWGSGLRFEQPGGDEELAFEGHSRGKRGAYEGEVAARLRQGI